MRLEVCAELLVVLSFAVRDHDIRHAAVVHIGVLGAVLRSRLAHADAEAPVRKRSTQFFGDTTKCGPRRKDHTLLREAYEVAEPIKRRVTLLSRSVSNALGLGGLHGWAQRIV